MRLTALLWILALLFGRGSSVAAGSDDVERRKIIPYAGPLIDAVVQWPDTIGDLGEIVRHLRKAGVDRAGMCNGIHIARRTREIESRRPLFFLGTPKSRGEDLASSKNDGLIRMIKSRDYSFVGELMYRHAKKKERVHSEGEIFNDPLSDDSLHFVGQIDRLEKKMPIFVHWEFYRWKEDYPRFSALFERFPHQTFIINHLGFGDPDQVRTILDAHPNVFFTISKKLTPFEYFSDPGTEQGPPLLDQDQKLMPGWKALFLAYPTRFLFATDAHKDYMWNHYETIVDGYRLLLAQLPEDAARKIASQNAVDVFRLK